jgi:RDD family
MHPSEALSPRDIFGSRFTASFLDLALVAAAIGPLAGSGGLIFALAFSFLYLGIAQGLTGMTLAKALLGVRVVKAGTTQPAGLIAGVVRWLAAPLGIPLFTAIGAAFNDRRRGLGDYLARTEVIGLAPETRVRVLSVIGYLVVLEAFIAASSFNTFLILNAIFAPMVIAGLVVVLGSRRMPGGVMWLAALGFAFVPACLMSFQGLCDRGGGVCDDLSAAHKAIPALIALTIAIVIVFTVRGIVQYVAVAALTAASAIWMFFRLRDVEDMGFASLLLLILLALAVAGEGVRYAKRRAEERDAEAQAAAAAAHEAAEAATH